MKKYLKSLIQPAAGDAGGALGAALVSFYNNKSNKRKIFFKKRFNEKFLFRKFHKK